MIAELICIIIGLLNVTFPQKIWSIGQFMFRLREGKFVFATEEPTSLVLLLHRIGGAFFIIVGSIMLFI